MTPLIIPLHLAGGIALTKYDFHKDGMTFLHRLQKRLGVKGKVKSNKAGPAIYGDIRLETETFEVVLLTDALSDTKAEIKILYRTRTLYDTGPNQWTTLKEVEDDPASFVAKINSLMLESQ